MASRTSVPAVNIITKAKPERLLQPDSTAFEHFGWHCNMGGVMKAEGDHFRRGAEHEHI